MSFRPLRHIKVPYKRQVMIYAVCVNYHSQPQATREKIDRLCEEVCADAEQAAALREWLITDGNAEVIALKHYTSAPTLYRRRAKFYKRF